MGIKGRLASDRPGAKKSGPVAARRTRDGAANQLFVEIQSVFADAISWLGAGLALPFTFLLIRPRLWQRLKSRTSRVVVTVVVCLPIVFWGWTRYEARPVRQKHELALATEGNCTAMPPDPYHGDVKLDSGGGGCTVRQLSDQAKTYAEKNRYTIIFDMRRFLSTPGTGFEAIDDRGEVHQLLARQRGFKVGHNWCLEVVARHKNAVRRLNPETCVALAGRPDRAVLTLEYDGTLLQVETRFMSDHPRDSAFLPNPEVVKVPYVLARPAKILSLITTVGQAANDQRGFDAAILSFLWQKHDAN
jgi:hypothetical protein